MDFSVAIVGEGFVLLAADSAQARSIVVMKQNMDKMVQLSSKLVMTASGPAGDTAAFSELMQKNLKLQALRNGYETSTWSSVNYIRHQLAHALRSRGAYQVNLLIAGCDALGPQLYYMDYLASMNKVQFAAQGYGSFFTYSILDRWYRPGMALPDAVEVLRKCLAEVRLRFIANFPSFVVRIVDADGVREINIDA
eukprot:m.19300 g.19300  ORF g.19300 m.19300 type:complete len:195 (-) comp7554_c0_seq1:43-627(-)